VLLNYEIFTENYFGHNFVINYSIFIQNTNDGRLTLRSTLRRNELPTKLQDFFVNGYNKKAPSTQLGHIDVG